MEQASGHGSCVVNEDCVICVEEVFYLCENKLCHLMVNANLYL